MAREWKGSPTAGARTPAERTTDEDAARAPAPGAVTVIEPSRGWRDLGLGELWRSRELVLLLGRRIFRVRYKQTVLGVAWAFARPFTQMVVFSLVFGQWLRVGSEGAAYPVFVYSGLLPWTLFSQVLAQASQSIVGERAILTKVYFPRLAIPVATVGVCLVDFAIALATLLGLLLYYGEPLTAGLAAIVPLTVLTVALSLGVGCLLAALHVAYRDMRYVRGFLLSMWLFLTPVIYPVARLPAGARRWLLLNPMYGVVGGFRSAVLGQAWAPQALAASTALAAVLLVAGLAYFRRVERRFADIV